MKLKKRDLFIGVFSILLLIIACTPVQERAVETPVLENKTISTILDARTELIDLISKAQSFPEVMLGLTEEITNDLSVQTKTTNLSYTNDSIKIINHLVLKEQKDNVTYSTIDEWSMELVKNGVYTQCLLDIDIWMCEEVKLSKEQVQEIFDEIKDKKFVENIKEAEKKDNCYLINKELLDCYDENGFLVSMNKGDKKVVRNYLKFEKDNFSLPVNSEIIE